MPTSMSSFSISHLRVHYDDRCDLFLATDLTGVIIESKGCSEKTLGYSNQEILGKNFASLLHPDDRERSEEAFQRLVSRDVEFLPHFENRFIHADGSIRHIHWAAFLQESKIVAYGRDVTSLRTTERAFSQMQQIAKIGSWRHVVASWTTEWSEGIYRIYELPLDTDVNKLNRLLFFAEEYRPRIAEGIQRCVSEGVSFDIEAPIILRSGKQKWVRWIGHPVRFEGKIIEAYGIFQDITDLKLQQIEIEQQRMSLIENSKLSALGQMAAGIAHEVYNPLTVIQGKTLISKKNGNASSRDLDAILENCRRIEKIIRSMTALARKEQKDAAENFEVSSWLEDVLLLCNEKMNREKIAFEVAIPEGLRITGQPVPLSQILVNLLNNSIDAMAELEEKKIRLKIETQADNIELTVADSAPPIPEEIRGKMFEPFFTTKPIGKGTGLGLSIARAIAQDHGGELFYDPSLLKKGFTLRIPQSRIES